MSLTELRPRSPWEGARVVLGVTGGIAAYKSVQLARDLTRLGAVVDPVLSRGALEFIQPLTFEAVTGRRALTQLFATTDGGPRGGAALHVGLGADADVVCVAPATADFLARAAHGRANDLITTTLLATEAPVVLAPAMNDRMFRHPQVQANLTHCRDVLGYSIAGPGVGALAHGEGSGVGRMLDPTALIQHIGRALSGADLTGARVLVTAGPTREAIDPVRYVGNRSSGRMGFALAESAWRLGADVTLVSGPVALHDPEGINVVRVEDARAMEHAVREALPDSDVAIFAAAVADFRPLDSRDQKLKRAGELAPVIALEQNPDIAASSRALRKPGCVTVGFALETERLLENARKKREAKEFDLLVANEVGDDSGFETSTNRVTILGPGDDVAALDVAPKEEIADAILERVVTHWKGGRAHPRERE